MLNMKSKIFKYIYAMLCLLPAIAVSVTCVYVAINDNAYQSYGGTTENSMTNEVIDDVADFNTSDTYFLTLVYGNTNSGNIGASGNRIYVSNFEVLENSSQFDLSNTIAIGFYQNPNSYSIGYYFWYGSNTGEYYNLSSGTNLLVSFNYLSNNLGTTNILTISNAVYTHVYSNYNSLDNVFYYSLDKVENSSVFSWVKSNFLYSGVNQFVGIFGGTNSNISFYLTWVLTISLCYLGFEVLMLFINMARNLIHSFTDKDRW